jgi:hypothetical protein
MAFEDVLIGQSGESLFAQVNGIVTLGPELMSYSRRERHVHEESHGSVRQE